MKAYSVDLRERVVEAAERGTPRSEIAEVFHVSLSTIRRYVALKRETGRVDLRPRPGRVSRKGAALRTGLLLQLEAHRDATLSEHCRRWEESFGVRVSTATMSRAIRDLGWTRKKRRWEPPSGMSGSGGSG